MSLAFERLVEAKDFLIQRFNINKDNTPHVGLVLGSGLSALGESLKKVDQAQSVLYRDIPYFCSSTVEGHQSELIFSRIGDVPVLVMSGRLHGYEGHSPSAVALPIQVLGLLGIKNLVLTNAAGAIADEYNPGEIMLIKDHINLAGNNPLAGPNIRELGPRFFDMAEAYDSDLRSIAKEELAHTGLTVHEGTYLGVLGPSYETPAEIQFFKRIGADAVGMSTVYETLVARHMGVNVLALSCLTNKAAGLSTTPITHEEVMANNRLVSEKLTVSIRNIIQKIG